MTPGHGWSDIGWKVSSVQQGVYDYSPEAGEEARVQAERGWGQGQAILMLGSTSSFTAMAPHTLFTWGTWGPGWGCGRGGTWRRRC